MVATAALPVSAAREFESTSASESQPRALPIELAVVVPTFNERDNISLLVPALEKALPAIQWELIFVDDNSPDGTGECIRRLAATDRRIRVLERIGRRGLSSACIEGMLATPAPYIAVMDADLQHDERVLPKLLELMKSEDLDIAVASRNLAGGSCEGFSAWRLWLSSMGSRMGRLVCRSEVSDPMSGFFLVNRAFFRQTAHRLSGAGFKILVDLLASSPRPVRVGEVPYHFRRRQLGESKLDVRAELEYLYLILDKTIGRIVPTRFVLFVLVGSAGLVIHLSTLGQLYGWEKTSFKVAQLAGTIVAMTFNFLLNNVVTFRDRQLRGWRLASGLLTFYAACSLGAVINVSFAQSLFHLGFAWYVAGLAGMAVSSVWNYGVNLVLTWRRNSSSAASATRS
ncbi:MAG: glycosyltransferase family 2 protein [Terriglobales bacterium]